MHPLKFNPPERLPPVGCWLLIRLPDGTVVQAKRLSHIQTRELAMEYQLETGLVIKGRFDWTYP
jgi:hypothetical protein